MYTVAVTVTDDSGGSASGTLVVYVGPTLTLTADRVVNEGSLLSIPGIGQFTDSTPARLNPGGSDNGPYTYTINWGDGRAVDGGLTTIDAPSLAGAATSGSFSGSHTYGNTGVYTVTVKVTAGDGRSATSTLAVTVNDVPPMLTVVSDQTVGQTRPLSLPDIGKFTDPGFDTPLNVGGQTTQRFTYTVNWGDGTAVDAGAATINVPGQVGFLTAGSFNGAHTFAGGGNFNVTVTVSDNNGGSATQSFGVVVAPIASILSTSSTSSAASSSQTARTLLFFSNGAGSSAEASRVVIIEATARPVAPQSTAHVDVESSRVGSVTRGESRLVLRIVLPSGAEDQDNDEPLTNEVLDNLRKLLKRLPDGHYRIYQIQPDAVERLVVDVVVREGRSIDAADEAEDSGDSSLDDNDSKPVQPAPRENETGRREEGDATERTWNDAALALGGFVVYSTPGRGKSRIGQDARRFDERSLTKVRRLLRRIR